MNMIMQEDLQRYLRLREYVSDAEKHLASKVKEFEFEASRISSLLIDGSPVEPGPLDVRFLFETVPVLPLVEGQTVKAVLSKELVRTS